MASSTGNLLLVGRVYRAHGLLGEMKVIPETDEPKRFSGLESVFLGDRAENAVAYPVEKVRFQDSKHGITVVLKLAGIESKEAADSFRKANIYAREVDLPPVEEDEVFLHDLIGLTVLTEEGEMIGKIRDVLEMPAQLVLVVEQEGGSEVMIPDVPEIVRDVDVDGGTMTIRPIDGLIE